MPKNKYTPLIQQKESLGQFDQHITTPSANYKKLNPDKFEYLPKNIFYKIGQTFVRIVLFLLVPVVTFFGLGLKIKGRKKIKALKGKGAIIVSNHVLALESLAMRQLSYGRNTYYISLKENYFKHFGIAMQMGGILPLSDNLKLSKKLENTIDTITTKHNDFVVIYAEQSLWPGYTRIRPLKRGAFYFSAKFNTPIVPVVTLFRQPNKLERFFGRKYNITMQVLDPIYPSSDMGFKQNVINLNEQTHSAMLECANAFYGMDCDATHYVKSDKIDA